VVIDIFIPPKPKPRDDKDKKKDTCASLGLPECKRHFMDSSEEACYKCNGIRACKPDNGDPIDPYTGQPIVSEDFIFGSIKHYSCKIARKEACDVSVLCGQCCINTKKGVALVTKCKCAAQRRDDDDEN
jgi:hypothetical protein